VDLDLAAIAVPTSTPEVRNLEQILYWGFCSVGCAWEIVHVATQNIGLPLLSQGKVALASTAWLIISIHPLADPAPPGFGNSVVYSCRGANTKRRPFWGMTVTTGLSEYGRISHAPESFGFIDCVRQK
jgi:hypothetical protein